MEARVYGRYGNVEDEKSKWGKVDEWKEMGFRQRMKGEGLEMRLRRMGMEKRE